MRACELESELKGMFASQIADVVGNLPYRFVGASAGKTGIAELKVAASAAVIFASRGLQQDGWKRGIDHSGGCRVLVVAREAGVQFVEQIAAISVTPAGAGVVVAHE